MKLSRRSLFHELIGAPLAVVAAKLLPKEIFYGGPASESMSEMVASVMKARRSQMVANVTAHNALLRHFQDLEFVGSSEIEPRGGVSSI